MKRNSHFERLKPSYLFPEINQRKKEYLAKNPNASLISLGIGDTTEPIAEVVSRAMIEEARALGTTHGYSGYGPEQGSKTLREKIASKIYHHQINPDDIYISDGAKCDLGRLQLLFGPDISIAVQDPAYPVYIDGSLINGVGSVHLMACTPENHFFPDLEKVPRTDLIYFCSPNNPTGATATKEQLKKLVDFAISNHSIIIYDSAYAHFIQDPALPKSIYEIEGAKGVAIEISSFSKIAGFTGVRLGWTVIPGELRYDNGLPVKADWHRLFSTIFNGASNIVQKGGEAVLSEEGWRDVTTLTHYYLENARLIKGIFSNPYGGENAPYIWVRYKGRKSWEVFQEILEQFQIVTTPGSGFGPSGDEFIRLSAFGKRPAILEAVDRLKSLNLKTAALDGKSMQSFEP